MGNLRKKYARLKCLIHLERHEEPRSRKTHHSANAALRRQETGHAFRPNNPKSQPVTRTAEPPGDGCRKPTKSAGEMPSSNAGNALGNPDDGVDPARTVIHPNRSRGRNSPSTPNTDPSLAAKHNNQLPTRGLAARPPRSGPRRLGSANSQTVTPASDLITPLMAFEVHQIDPSIIFSTFFESETKYC